MFSNYDVATSWYQKQAEQGQVKAQNHLGWMYKNGYGVAQNNALAAKWYAKSAAQNDPKGQYNLGIMFEQGIGVLKDYVTAVEYYRKAAEQGYAEAICRLGLLHEQGLVVPKDYGIAAAYYKKAAAQGVTEAHYHMGFMYEHGYGVIKNYNLAIHYYKAAIEEEHPQALYRLGLIYEQGYVGVAENFKLAVDLYQRSAKLDESQAQYRLGVMYERGLGVDKNNRLALFWYKKSAEQNDLNARDRLNKPFLMNTFTCSRHINGRNQLSCKDIDNIPPEQNYISVIITIKYEGSINIGNRVIISKEINNPYNDIYTEIMKRYNSDNMFSCLDCLFIPIYARYSNIFVTQYQEKLELINATCEQFWQQQEQILLQQADHIVDQIIEEKYKLILFGQQLEDNLLYASYATTETDSSSCYSADLAVSSSTNLPRFNIN